jgi:hypothetical protein
MSCLADVFDCEGCFVHIKLGSDFPVTRSVVAYRKTIWEAKNGIAVADLGTDLDFSNLPFEP